jgi:WD40 repeat protein
MGSTVSDSEPAPQAILRGHTSPVTALCLLGHSERALKSAKPRSGVWEDAPTINWPSIVVSGDSRGNLLVWDLDLEQVIANQKQSTEAPLLSIEAATDEPNLLITHSRDGCVRVIQMDQLSSSVADMRHAAGEMLEPFPMSRGRVLFRGEPHGFCRPGIIEFAASDRILIATSGGKNHESIYLWDARVSSEKPVGKLCREGTLEARRSSSTTAGGDGISALCLCMKALPAERTLLAGYEDNHMCAWDYRGRSDLPVAEVPVFRHAQPLLALDSIRPLAVDGSERFYTLATSGFHGQVAMMRYAPATACFETTAQLTVANAAISELAYRPSDTRILVGGCSDHGVRVLSAKSPYRKLALLRKHRGAVRCLRFADFGSVFATGADDSAIAIWTIYDTSFISNA